MDTTTQITPTFLTQRELAELRRMPERTLEDWRLMQTGPSLLSPGYTITAIVRPQILAGELGSIVVDVQTTVRVIILPR